MPDFPSLTSIKDRLRPEAQSLKSWRRVASHHRGVTDGNAAASAAASDVSLASTIECHTANCTNRIVTSRYTLLTFVPLNFWEQLQRPLNAYFVFQAILLCIPEFAPVSPLTMIIPLALAFSLSGMKEAVDDYRRHKGDTATNTRLYRLYDPKTRSFRATVSENLRVGDVLLLTEGEEVPCDVVPLCSADLAEGVTYCTTANLDGEADAKAKHSILAGPLQKGFRGAADGAPASSDDPSLSESQIDEHLTTLDELRQQVDLLPILDAEGPVDMAVVPEIVEAAERLEEVLRRTVVDVEPPSRQLKSFHGTAIVFDRPLSEIRPSSANALHLAHASRAGTATVSSSPGVPNVHHRVSLGVDELLVSTSVMTTTPFTLAIVVYTGNEAKIHRSRRPVPVKWSAIDRLTNRFAVGVFFLQFLLMTALCIVARLEMNRNEGAWYLQTQHTDKVATFFYIPIRLFLLLSYMVPLSVKVILELSKFYISELIEWDIDLYDEDTCVAATCNNRALTEELGLVQFVLADKTGTLTENTMHLRKLAVATSSGAVAPSAAGATGDDRPTPNVVQVFHVPDGLNASGGRGSGAHSLSEVSMGTVGLPSASHEAFLPPRCLDLVSAARMWSRDAAAVELAYAIALNNSCEVSALAHTSRPLSRHSSRGLTPNLTYEPEVTCNGQHHRTPNFTLPKPAGKAPSSGDGRRALHRSYASTSPDEVALVEKLADELSFTLLRRHKRTALIRRPAVGGALAAGDHLLPRPAQGHGQFSAELAIGLQSIVEKWDIIDTIPFTSARGLMTVLARHPDTHRGHIFVKGSDERVLAVCTSGPMPGVAHAVDSFASDGLRTLVFATRVLGAEATDAYEAQLKAATTITDGEQRREAVRRLQELLEKDLRVIGATGVEDELQKQVPETIEALRQANMRVWMLTGDKRMTAVQTAKLSGLVKESDTVLNFNADPHAPEHEQVDQLSRALEDAMTTITGVATDAVSPGDLLTRQRPDTETPLLNTPATRLDLNPASSRMDAFFAVFRRKLRSPGSSPTPIATAASGSIDRAKHNGAAAAIASESTFQSSITSNVHGRSRLQYVVIVTGRSLEVITRSDTLQVEFVPLLRHATTVVCCRVTPDQKAMIVSWMRRNKAQCLAVGDGGNDVAMIQEADVGIGITGKEGRQAAQAADFTIAKFRFLLPLLLCHGHTAVMRSSYLVQYTFYKSVILGVVQATFNAGFTMATGVSYFDSMALTLYNGVFTVVLSLLPVLDTHLPRYVLRENPQLYRICQSGTYMDRKSFAWFVLRAFGHGGVIFGMATVIFDGSFIGIGGQPYALMGTEYVAAYATIVLVQCLVVTIEFHSITIVHAVFIPLCFIAFFVCYAFYSSVFTESEFFGAFPFWMSQPPFWLFVLAATAAVMVPFVFFAGIRFHFAPNLLQLWRKKLYQGRTWVGVCGVKAEDLDTFQHSLAD
jgi:magnesium-transporting ATPase (P-type)